MIDVRCEIHSWHAWGVSHPLPPPFTTNTKVPAMGLQHMEARRGEERREEEKTLIKDPACQVSAFPAPRRSFTMRDIAC